MTRNGTGARWAALVTSCLPGVDVDLAPPLLACGNVNEKWIWPTSRDGNDPESVVGPVILPGM